MEDFNDILTQNSKEYYINALEAEKKGQYNSAVTLFFKALSSLCDLYVFIKEGIIPSSHSDRFRILKVKYVKIYNILDKDFPFYQDSYRTRLSKEVSLMLKEDVKKLFGILKINL